MKNDGRYCAAPVTHKATLGYIVECLNKFHDQPQTLVMPSIPVGRLMPSCIINNKKLAMNIDYLSKQRDLDDDQFIGVTSEIGFKFIINKNLLGTPKEFPFENIVLNGFEKYDEILTTLYGDWRQLPPEEKRVPHHDFVDMDLNHSFYTE